MSDGPEWFASRRYGYGSGPPISWQGWVVTILYAVVTVGLALLLHEHVYQMVAALVPITMLFLVITAKTTRGGWRWRWGDED